MDKIYVNLISTYHLICIHIQNFKVCFTIICFQKVAAVAVQMVKREEVPAVKDLLLNKVEYVVAADGEVCAKCCM